MNNDIDMLNGYYNEAGATIEYGDASCLFPVEKLDATMVQYRDAEVVLDDADGSDVIVVAPTSLASSYFLTQHALTVVRVDSLPATVQSQLADVLDAPLDTFDLIQIGKWNSERSNHSLTEFTVA